MSIHPSLLKRKILHVDMDAFYSSVEEREHPELQGKPVVVGGQPNTRSVVCTANYIARTYGIRSAMSCFSAKKLCPQAIFLEPHFDLYIAASTEIRKIFLKYTNIIEPLSLDEAYLDVTNNSYNLSATEIAKQIQHEIFTELKLTCSIGVAPNKLLAKIASDYKKPSGITIVKPQYVTKFMHNLPVRKLFGVGPVTEKRLAALNIHTCTELGECDLSFLESNIGNFAAWLIDAAQGIDERELETVFERKSYGRETTFPKDLTHPAQILPELQPLVAEICDALQEKKLQGKTVTLKIKFSDFTLHTKRKTLQEYTNKAEVILKVAEDLFAAFATLNRPIRLIGVALSKLENL